MGVLTVDMQRIVLEQRLGFVATVCPDGTPNLSPKGTTTVWDDDHLLFADIASPQTVRNLSSNPAIEVNVVDQLVRKGYRFKGTATVHQGDETYESGLRLFSQRGMQASPSRVRAVVLMTVEEARPLVSPAYEPGVSEDEIVAVWTERLLGTLRGEHSGEAPP